MSITNEQIITQLQNVIDPNTGLSYAEQKSIKDIAIDGDNIRIQLELGYPARSLHAKIQEQIQNALKSVEGIKDVQVTVTTEIIKHQVQKTVSTLPQIKNVIAVASGKGGVGKSTTSVNLALALAAEGARVGILDADIYGPSQAMMMGITDKPKSEDGETMEPLMNHDVQVMSIGLLTDPEEAIIWRAPMAVQALNQMLSQTNWKDIDYLVIDMPPGTGDIALSLAQGIPVTGGVIVTTPQDIALLDAQRGLKMFEQLGITVLGIVENMSVHICSNCGHAEHIFGKDGAQGMAQKFHVDYLGGLPLAMSIREQADSGSPTVVSNPDSAEAQLYRDIAIKIAAKISKRPRDYSSIMPKVRVE